MYLDDGISVDNGCEKALVQWSYRDQTLSVTRLDHCQLSSLVRSVSKIEIAHHDILQDKEREVFDVFRKAQGEKVYSLALGNVLHVDPATEIEIDFGKMVFMQEYPVLYYDF